MKTWARRRPLAHAIWLALLCFLCVADVGTAASRRSRKRETLQIPILMESSTVRGKIVVLESRREDRKTVEGLLIQVWPLPGEDDEEEEKLLHETHTDKDGFFALPLVPVGEYRLIAGELELRLQVIEKADVRSGQDEPKILLILIPKEVL